MFRLLGCTIFRSEVIHECTLVLFLVFLAKSLVLFRSKTLVLEFLDETKLLENFVKLCFEIHKSII